MGASPVDQDALIQLLLAMFGDQADVVCGPGGEPVGLRVTIPLTSGAGGIQDALKLFNADADADKQIG